MKRYHVSVFVLGILALFATGCVHQSSRQASDAGTAAPKHLTEAIEIPRQTLVFEPTRDDITIGCVIFSLWHSNSREAINLEAIRVNGVKPEVSVLYLKQAGKNQFELPALKIEFSTEELGGPLYVTVKAWFNEVTNITDSRYYENAPDRYALLSYCTNEDEDPSNVHARMGANRVATTKEFNERLARPFVIRLNHFPLRVDEGYPMISNYARNNVRPLSEADLKELQKLVRDRGEEHLTSISARGSDHAQVRASVEDATRFYGMRDYKVVRKEGAWQIESVKSTKNASW
jgi:hypothetical protein